jgi:hypothetical protein
MSLCLASGALIASLALNEFTLSWTHSIEKLVWEEDWVVREGTLQLEAARIRGPGAGMEIPPGAMLRNGVWHYRPSAPPIPQLRLTHSPFAADYRLCSQGNCQTLAQVLPGLDNITVVELFACP